MEYTITINAPKEKVWSTLWNDEEQFAAAWPKALDKVKQLAEKN
jgi:uncharacterized membrane protein